MQQCLNADSLLTWQKTALGASHLAGASPEESPHRRQSPVVLPAGIPSSRAVSARVAYLVLWRSRCRMLLLGDVLSQTPADPLLLLLGVSLQT